MANYLSDQLTIVDDGSASFGQLKPNEAYGRVRCSFFKYTTPVGGLLIADTLALVDLPKGARLLSGRLLTGVLGASVTGTVGTLASAARYLGSTAIAAASATDFANTLALNQGEEVAVITRIYLTFAGANPAAGIVIQGFVLYVVD